MAATILLVDSDAINSSDWKAFLQEQGYKVVEARYGRTAIEQCPVLQPDLVLVNTLLSDMQGFHVCQQLKADPLNRLTPVILMAHTSTSFESQRGREVGADDFWNWPASRWEALNRVQAILQLKSYIDEQAEAVLLALARSVESKHRLMCGHSERLSDYTGQFGRLLGLSEDDLESLRLGSLLHDVGKVAVPDTILLKPGRLTKEETRVVRQHPIVGESICAPLKSLRHVLPIVRCHHERANGSGYPDGLSAGAIPLTAMIVQLADIYDALTTNRPYRKALSRTDALQLMIIESNEGLLDRELVAEFSNFVETAAQAESHSMLRSYLTH